MKDVRFLEIAADELKETVKYYNNESPGLGERFLLTVIETIGRIQQYPSAWHPFTKNTRRCQVPKFPYGVIYQELEEEILIVAIANLHRKPDYWINRI